MNLTGTNGDDFLEGSTASDTISGLEGDDNLNGGGGDDTVYGGPGNDFVFGDTGNDLLDGGDGDDFVSGSSGDDSILGGDGNDLVFTGGAASGDNIDLGAGDDEVNVGSAAPATSITTGSGSDRIEIGSFDEYSDNALQVTDFTAGAGGDVLAIESMLLGFTNWDGSTNPFAAGYLQLVQVGADTVLQIDAYGFGFVDLVTLEGVTLGDVTAENFDPPFPLDGSPLPGQELVGTPDSDFLEGSTASDTISGLDGDDNLYGGGGDDSVYGGAGNDVVSGGTGNDLLDGGEGDDGIEGSSGDDSILGGDGNDTVYSGTAVAGDNVDLGAGDDYVHVTSAFAATSITTGSGSDRIEIGSFEQYSDNALQVTDFTAGAGGDVLAIESMLLGFTDWDGSTNPFAAGYLQLVQVGADTVLQIDAYGDGFVDLVTLQGVTLGDVTAENFDPPFPLDGSPLPGQELVGTPESDYLEGSTASDTISGLEGDDNLYGGGGDDTVYGGAGNDFVFGDTGNDLLDGGDGDDFLSGSSGDDSILGGDGNDLVFTGEAASGDNIDLGAGDDEVTVGSAAPATSITTGSGSDRIEIGSFDQYSDNALQVTDFTAGAGGDVLAIESMLLGFTDWDGSTNPFAAGYLQLVQVGADTVLQIDAYGFGFVDLVTLEGVTLGDVTAENFDPPFPLDAAPLPGLELVGTEGLDNLDGDRRGDTISGLDGDDYLFGRGGDDTIFGGSGNDQLEGDGGNDTLRGEEGNDRIFGGEGSDTIYGGDGNDIVLTFSSGGPADAGDIIDLGAGDDGAIIDDAAPATTITTGSGTDGIAIERFDPYSDNELTVTDFTAGAGGDIVDLQGGFLSFTDWDGTTNPFAAGYLQLVQVGPDTILQINAYGDGFVDLVTLEGVNVGDLTGDNFSPPFPPDGSPIPGQELVGTPDADFLEGGFGNDTITGLDGSDDLFGKSGDDSIYGGAGDDIISGDDGNDILDGGDGDDYIFAGFGGEDSILGGGGSDFVSGVGSGFVADSVDLGAGNDTVSVTYATPASQVTTGTGTDTIIIRFASGGDNQLTVTDFTAGPGGDILNIQEVLLDFGWDGYSNPFASGNLQLVQVGADAVLQIEALGNGFVDLVTLQGVDVSDITGDNFDPPFPPDGGPIPGQELIGTPDIDFIEGTRGGDTITGLEGDDELFGQGGDDTIFGGDGNDLIGGGSGSNTLFGGDGNDIVYSEFTGTLGDTVDLGSGNDTVYVVDASATTSITTGAGADTLHVWGFEPYNENGLSVSDFTAGAGGDVLALEYLLSLYTTWDGTENPFAAGLLQVVQVGADSVVQINAYGDGFVDLVTLQNVAAVNLTSANFVPAYPPTIVGGPTNILTGTEDDDILTGTPADESLYGLGGNDELFGGLGIDTLFGGEGDDYVEDRGDGTIYGGAGNDTVNSGDGVVEVHGDDGDDFIALFDNLGIPLTNGSIFGGAGNDTISTELVFGTIDGGEGIDSLEFGEDDISGVLINDVETLKVQGRVIANVGQLDSFQTILASSAEIILADAGSIDVSNKIDGNFNSFFLSSLGENTLTTGNGTDTIWGGTANDVVYAGAGNDSIEDFGGDDVLYGDLGLDDITDYGGNDTIYGGGGNDNVRTEYGSDLIYAGSGNDNISAVYSTSVTIFGDAGDDYLNAVNDTDAAGVFTIYGGSGNDSIEVTQYGATGSASSNLYGGAGDDLINGSDGNDTLYGGAGADVLSGGGGEDVYVVTDDLDTIYADSDDTIRSSVSFDLATVIGDVDRLILTGTANINAHGTENNEYIEGNGGDNWIYSGSGGGDTLVGRNGDDFYVIDDDDIVRETANQGYDTVYISVSYTLTANVEALVLTGSDAINGTGNNSGNAILGNDASNRLDGKGGDDSLVGGDGDDLYVVDSAGDIVIEYTDEGDDTINAFVSYRLSENVERLNLKGDGNINGTGNSGGNMITGNNGDNRLNGELGADTLNGGAGADTFVFSTTLGAGNVDRILAFNVAEDTFELSAEIFDAIGVGQLSSEEFTSNTSGQATTANHRIVYENDNGRLYYDADGNGAGVRVQFAQLAPGLTLTEDNFTIV